ncbi:hypothetical protein Q2T40_00515 [Winogradskyella maritima]|nr:hypothetical protein [Winogradskyella maritima]
MLYKDFPDEIIPTVLTVHNILKKHGLVPPQKRLRRVKPIHPVFDPKECNEVWSADYKGSSSWATKFTVIRSPLQTQRADLYLPQKGITKKTLPLQKPSSKGFSGNSASPDKSIPTMEAHLVLCRNTKIHQVILLVHRTGNHARVF